MSEYLGIPKLDIGQVMAVLDMSGRCEANTGLEVVTRLEKNFWSFVLSIISLS